ncbi:MAG: PPC domain-containing protein, partial [Oceanococcaceae bacterium]
MPQHFSTSATLLLTSLCLAPSALWAAEGSLPAYQSTKADDGLMELDEAYFWPQSGTYDGMVSSSAACTEQSCARTSIDISSGAARLRVGIATPERTDTFALEIYGPDGSLRASDATNNQFNSEAMVDAPEAGTWEILVRPQNVSLASFRLRAKL